MAKPTFTRLSSLINGVTAINGVITEIEDAFENTVSRDGSSPNTLTADLDANSQRLYNLPDPTTTTEPITLHYAQNNGLVGDTGPTGPAAWDTPEAWAGSTSYTTTAPASCVTYNGETYVCTTTHTSTGVFDASKWIKVAQKGVDGLGAGDLISTNNLSDLDNAATARANLGLGTAAVLDVGTTANKIVQLNGSAQLPAVDGSLLTGVTSSPSPTTGSGDWVRATAPTLVTPDIGAANGTSLTLDAGTTTVAPITLQSGTNLTTAAAGSFEYGGKTLLFTPMGTQRGVVPGMQFFKLENDLAGANSTGAQNVLGVGCTLSASTIYEFELFYTLSKSSGTTSHSLSTLFGGTATLNNIFIVQEAIALNAAWSTGIWDYPLVGLANVATATVQYSSSTSGNKSFYARMRGFVSVNAGGTFTPQYSLSAAPGAAYTTKAGSYMKIYPVAASGANINVGAWA